jgi:hypothetical protein
VPREVRRLLQAIEPCDNDGPDLPQLQLGCTKKNYVNITSFLVKFLINFFLMKKLKFDYQTDKAKNTDLLLRKAEER